MMPRDHDAGSGRTIETNLDEWFDVGGTSLLFAFIMVSVIAISSAIGA